MAQKIPFFNMFADLLPPPELKIRLGGAVITGAVIDQSSFVMELQITTRQLLTAEDIEALQKIIAATYGFSAVTLKAECSEPLPTLPAWKAYQGKKCSYAGTEPENGQCCCDWSGVFCGMPGDTSTGYVAAEF